MTYDTTIPGMSAETVPSAGSGQATGDGVVVVVGRFEREMVIHHTLLKAPVKLRMY